MTMYTSGPMARTGVALPGLPVSCIDPAREPSTRFVTLSTSQVLQLKGAT